MGGALAGGLLAVMMLKTWAREEDTPRMSGIAKGTVAVWLALLGYSVYAVGAGVSAAQAQARELIPAEMIPSTPEAVRDRAEELAKLYPNDPQSHWLMANLLLEKQDLSGAEEELRLGLSTDLVKNGLASKELKNAMSGVLALLLLEKGATEEIPALARDACAIDPKETIKQELVRAGACK